MTDFSKLDWAALDRLRATFLARAATGPYWGDAAALAAYDATYAERIGWKWDALLRELKQRGWMPPAGAALYDFGCGSGIAGRRVAAAFGIERFGEIWLHDHAPEAVAYAGTRLAAAYPGLSISARLPEDAQTDFVLVVSHVINEMDANGLDLLTALATRAEAVLWVEPGTHADSRLLAAARDRLRETHRIVAPCTHAANCPLFAPGNEREWCHFFAPPPTGVQASSEWVRFAQRAGVDLRSQAYACLVLERKNRPAAPDAATRATARVLGRPETHKAHANLLACEATGLRWLELPKRNDPALLKQLEKRPPLPLYRLVHDGRRISQAEPAVASHADDPASSPNEEITGP